MPESNNGINGMAKQIAVGIVIAATAGAWAIAATRAASSDVIKVEVESKARDQIITDEIKEFKGDFHREEIKQAVFRAEVRESLRNWEDRFDTIAPPR